MGNKKQTLEALEVQSFVTAEKHQLSAGLQRRAQLDDPNDPLGCSVIDSCPSAPAGCEVSIIC